MIRDRLKTTLRLLKSQPYLSGLALLTLLATGSSGLEGALIRSRLSMPELDAEIFFNAIMAGDWSLVLTDPALIAIAEDLVNAVNTPPVRLLGLALQASVVILILLTLALIADGGMIDGAAHENGFKKSTEIGIRKLGTLFVIASIPPLPLLLALALLLIALLAYRGLAEPAPDANIMLAILTVVWLILVVPAGIVTAILEVIRHFANRACVVDNLPPLKAFRAGWATFQANLEDGLIIGIIQLLASALLSSLVTVIGTVSGLLALLIPSLALILSLPGLLLILSINASRKAAFSILWTRTWMLWTAEQTPPD
jgi:hypothetical protein